MCWSFCPSCSVSPRTRTGFAIPPPHAGWRSHFQPARRATRRTFPVTALAEVVAEHGPLPASTVLMLVAGIAEALQVIHGAGIVHRDLKPSNVLLASDGPRVIDFGIARAADATALTASGVAVGTPAFMAPEQAAGGEVGGATDVFALGQVAAYAALGTPAYGDGPSHGVLYRIVHQEPDLSGLDGTLRPLVERCLAKDPSKRPSPAEVLDLCRTAGDHTRLRQPEDWLPHRVATGLMNRPAPPVPVPTIVAGVTPPTPPPPLAQPTVSARPMSAPAATFTAPYAAPPTPPVMSTLAPSPQPFVVIPRPPGQVLGRWPRRRTPRHVHGTAP
ncbi:serine/threonine-protein kinase [Streptomyces sp. NPDC001674]|uniref:serine/threonine-protein kinase n=1 Tax=Streptomyces sp. NPDC001674 TaxID=3154394 RepID=UPI003326A264